MTLEMTAMRAMRARITQVLPAQIKACLEKLDEEQIWWRPNESSNSVGNLVLHLSGSMRHYIARGLGGRDYQRNRPAEFSERGPVPKQQLIALFDETISQVSETIESLDTARLLDSTDDPSYNPTVFDLIFNVSIHLATHTGQILYITKMLEQGSLDELWIQTHKNLAK
ncbi:MAG TPA: DUF1572 family protein [Blastocatellia bacterium]|nr:DUF1572 family protein [Blastocatellia bacterium]